MSVSAQRQATWFIDPVNGNNANDGKTAVTALRTDAERQRRMGPWPQWVLEEYHIRYLNNVPASDPISFVGQWMTPTGNIYLHGNEADSEGKAVLATLTVSAVTAMNHATNTALQITASAIGTSWTADGLLDRRCRFTSGANVGGIVWPIADLATKKARMNEPQPAETFSNPLTPAPIGNTFTPAQGDTFVVESLVTLGSLLINIVGIGNSQVNTVVLDSLEITAFSATGTAGLATWGCIWSSTASGPNTIRVVNFRGARLRANSKLSVVGVLSLTCCYSDDSASGSPVFTAYLNAFATRHVNQQRMGTAFTGINSAPSGGSLHPSWSFEYGMGVFNNTLGPGYEVSRACMNSSCEVWGVCEAGGTPFLLKKMCDLTYTVGAPGPAAYYYVDVTLAPAGAWISYRSGGVIQTTAPAWDAAASPPAFTAYRTLTPTNIQASVAGGGFNGQFFEPLSGCRYGSL